MYYGHYFRLDTDVTNIEKGIAVFRYCPDSKTNSDIYVTFSDDEIEFNSIGIDADKNAKNASILHIPINENLERSFANTVTEAFYRNTGEMHMNPHEISHLSYYSTFYFGLNSKHAEYWKKPRTSGSIHGSHSIPEPLSVRKLILDFLFDLQETRLFQMSPHYGALTEKFRQNFFARCLAAKARYWYQRALYEEITKESKHVSGANERVARKNKRRFYGEILFKAEKEWGDCIRDPRSEQTFHNEYYDWFDDCETEMRRIYKPYLPVTLKDGVIKDTKKECDNLTSKWFVARFSGLTSWNIFLRGHRSFFGIHLFWPRIVFSIATAWYTLVLIEGINVDDETISKIINNIVPFSLLVLTMIFTASLIVIRRVVPLVKNTVVRATRLSGFVMAVSYIIGCVLLHAGNILWSHNKFLFFLISAAFIGLVLQIVLQGENPSDSL